MIVLRRSPARTVLMVLVLVLTAVLAAQIIWVYRVSPRLAIRRVIFEGDSGFSDAQLLEMLDVSGETWASVNEEELAARMERFPEVRQAQVIKVFPDTLRLFVYRRKPLVVALVRTDNQMVPAVFDEEGYAVQVGIDGSSLDLPVISGPRFSLPVPGARLPEQFLDVLNGLARLRSEEPELFAVVSELELTARRDEALDVKLYMNHVPVPVLVGRSLTAQTVHKVLLVLDILNADPEENVREADMRGEHLVFRRTEEG